MIKLNINGEEREITSPPETPSLWVIRDEIGLTGTKYGCGHGVCGCCIVNVDDTQVHACKNTVAEMQGKKITTIEGQQGKIADAIFDAWKALDVAQCGFCQPGQINSASVLLANNPNPTDEDIDEALKHNLCRCATYVRVRKAIHQAADTLAKG